MNVIAFGASSSSTSINKQLAGFAANQMSSDTFELLDLNDYELPLFSTDLEAEIGHPEAVHAFIEKLQSADVLVISMAEHNGSYSAAFKNLFDWCSRVKSDMFDGADMVLLATSPGGRGGLGVLEAALDRFPRHGANIVGSFSLPSFYDNFDSEKGITDPELHTALSEVLSKLKAD